MTFMKINEENLMEVRMDTNKDRKLQYNDICIQYLHTSGFISLALDTEPLTILCNYSVFKKGKPVSFKIKSIDSGSAIKMFDVKNIMLF